MTLFRILPHSRMCLNKCTCQSILPKNGIIRGGRIVGGLGGPTNNIRATRKTILQNNTNSSSFHTSSKVTKASSAATTNTSVSSSINRVKAPVASRSNTSSVTATATRTSTTSASNATASTATASTTTATTMIPPPTRQQLKTLLLSSAIPMVGFGFMDNFIMIQAGGLIDSTICVQFGLATMTAAAMGQVVSDVSGVLFGGALEGFLTRMGIAPVSNLTLAQRSLRICQRTRMTGAALGVMVGCALGATSLLLLDTDRHYEQESNMSSSSVNGYGLDVRHVLSNMFDFESNHCLKSEVCTLYLVDHTKRHGLKSIKGKLDVHSMKDIKVNSQQQQQQQQHAAQCYDTKSSIVDNNHRELSPNHVLRSMLCVPVQTKRGELVGVLEFKNKRPDERGLSFFSKQDEQMAGLLGDHVGILLDQLGDGGGNSQ